MSVPVVEDIEILLRKLVPIDSRFALTYYRRPHRYGNAATQGSDSYHLRRSDIETTVLCNKMDINHADINDRLL